MHNGEPFDIGSVVQLVVNLTLDYRHGASNIIIAPTSLRRRERQQELNPIALREADLVVA